MAACIATSALLVGGVGAKGCGGCSGGGNTEGGGGTGGGGDCSDEVVVFYAQVFALKVVW